MKKLFRFFVATALVAFVAACGNDSTDPYVPSNGDTDVTFSVAMPEGIASRADFEVSDGTSATHLDYAIYVTGDLEDKAKPQVLKGEATFVNKQTEFTVRLVAGKSYDIIFWATAPENGVYTVDWTTKVLSIDYTNDVTGNNEKRDAFVWVERGFVVKGQAEPKTITLYRPFARLNIGLDDVYTAMQAGYQLDATQVTASTHTQFDFSLGTAEKPGAAIGEMQEVTFDWATPVTNPATFKLNNGDEYDWASFNYLLANTPSETTDVTVSFRYKEDQTPVTLPEFSWIPIERNHRTNIVGSLLTDPATFKVVIDERFDDPAHERVVWDGQLEALPAPAEDGYVYIETPGQLATLLAKGSANENDNAGKYKLANDIDMGGYTVNVFDGRLYNLELDGQNYTISNLVPESGTKYNALFPILVNSTVKNLVIDGIVVMPAAARADIEGDYYAAALVAATYGTVNIEKVTVKGAKIAGVNKVGGLVGFVAENVLNVDGAVVEASEIATLSEADGGCIGGLIGYVTTNATVKNSTVQNTKITAVNSAGEAKRANSEFIGAFHGSDNTTLTIEKAALAENTFVETANGYVAPAYFLGLVGGNRLGGGKVIIDGKEATDVVPSPWCLIGVNGDWTKDVPMVVAENGMAVAYGIELKEGNFKVRIPNDDGSWNDAANYGVDPNVAGAKVYANMPIPVFTGGGSGNIVPVVYATYDIYFDEANKVVYLMEAGKPVSEAVEFEKFREKLNLAEGNTWGIAGSFNEWGEDIATMEIGEIDGELWAVAKNLKITAADEFKFRANGSWSLNYGGPQKMEIGKLYEGVTSGDNMSVAADGYYNLYFSMDYATIKIEAGDAPVVKPEIVKVSVESLEFAAEGGEQTIELELVGEAELEITKPEVEGWVSINVAENVLTVSVAANETTEVIEGTIVLTYGESTVSIPVKQAGKEVVAPEKVSIADFLNAEVGDKIYELTGTITEIKDTTWGNFYFEDESGSVYVYGLKDAEGNNIDWAATGLNVNDVITIQGKRSDYQGTAQVADAIYISHVDQEAPAVTIKQATVAEFLNATVGDGITYQLTGKVTGVYNTTYGNFYLEDATGTVQIYGVVKPDGESKVWGELGVVEGDIITLQGARGEYGGNAQMQNGVYIGHVTGEPEIKDVDPSLLTFSSAGGSQKVTVSTYGEATLKASVVAGAEYFSAEVTGNEVTVTAKENTSTDIAPEGQLELTYGASKVLVALKQGAKSAEGESEPVTVSLTMADLGLANAASVDGKEINVGDDVVLVFNQGKASTAPAYYTSGSAIRMYQNGATLDVTAGGKTITAVEFTFANNMNYLVADSGTMSNANANWNGEAVAVKFTCNGTDKNSRAYVAAIKVTYLK